MPLAGVNGPVYGSGICANPNRLRTGRSPPRGAFMQWKLFWDISSQFIMALVILKIGSYVVLDIYKMWKEKK